jgi:uncharacterized membrane protein
LPSAAVRALGLGAISGLRSTSGPAALSRAISSGRAGNLDGTLFGALGAAGVAKVLTLFEVGEMIVDKLPIVPSRTSASPLLGRAASGAVVGAALFASEDENRAVGGALAAAAAVAAALAGERLRTQIGQRLGVPDSLVAFLEDGVVLYGGYRLTR